MLWLIENTDLITNLLPDATGWLVQAGEGSLRLDDGVVSTWFGDGEAEQASPLAIALWTLFIVASAALLWWWKRPLALWTGRSPAVRVPEAGVSETDMPESRQVDAMRRMHARRRNSAADRRAEALMELYRLYTQGETDKVYEGLKSHLDAHPFELDFYIIALNMLAETGSRPSAEMIRLIRHALRQLKVHRPRMWRTVAEHGRRVLPDFDHWDELAPLSTHRHPHL